MGSAITGTGSKSEQAYVAVKTRIVDGGYPPGHRLVLGRIAEDLGVSVVPVREAIRRLEAEGLVRFQRNIGATVAGIDPTEYRYTMQTLSILEGAATALSSPLTDVADLARARAVNEDLRACLEDFDPLRFTRLNRDFHGILFENCPNPHILDLVHRGWDRLAALRASTFRFVPGRARESVQEHDALLELIASGAAADDVERAARLHRSATLDAYLALTAPDPGAVPGVEHRTAHGADPSADPSTGHRAQDRAGNSADDSKDTP